jgi:hypothetical protein
MISFRRHVVCHDFLLNRFTGREFPNAIDEEQALSRPDSVFHIEAGVHPS